MYMANATNKKYGLGANTIGVISLCNSECKYQSTLDVKQNARLITLAFILLELFPFELCHKIVSALLIENHSRYLFETSFEYQSTAYHVQSARMELCKYSMIIYFFLNDECAVVNSIARLSLLDITWIVCT